MDETSVQIERHIRETRNDLSENFNELEEKVKTAVDWRAQFEERPATMIGLAFGGGILLSALLSSGRSPRRRNHEHRWNPQERDAQRVSPQSRTARDEDDGRKSETWDAFKGALVGVAVTKLSGFIEDLLPGFEQEFAKAQGGRKFDRSGPSSPNRPSWQKSAAAGVD